MRNHYRILQSATPSTTEADKSDDSHPLPRSPARYLWAALIACLFEMLPLTCCYCRAEINIITFVTETPSVRAILEQTGEPTRPPALASERPGVALSCSAWAPAQTFPDLVVRCSIAAHPPWEDAPVEFEPDYDPLLQPEPAMDFGFPRGCSPPAFNCTLASVLHLVPLDFRYLKESNCRSH